MDSASSVALSGQNARERQMDVLANNIANLSTTAFKGQQMLFAEVLSNVDGAPVRYVQDAGTVRDWSQGPLTRTGNSLDVALQGDGFFEVQTAQGIRYTRDGRLKLDSQGELVTLEGDPVLGDSQSPIVVPQGTASITVGDDGTLTTPTGTAGRLTVVSFDKLQAVASEENGLYSTDETPNPATRHESHAGHARGIERAADSRNDAAHGGVARRRHGQELPGQRVRSAQDRHRPARQNRIARNFRMRSLNIAATGMLAQQLNVEVISNNIANLNTTAFKKQRAEFQDLLYQSERRVGATSSDTGTIVPVGVQIGSGVKAAAVYRLSTQGNLINTNNPSISRFRAKAISRSRCRTARPPTRATARCSSVRPASWSRPTAMSSSPA